MILLLSTQFLTEHQYYDHSEENKKQIVFHFNHTDGLQQMKGVIGIPLSPDARCWSRYFEKDRKIQFTDIPAPTWFEELVEQAHDYSNKKFRLKKMYS